MQARLDDGLFDVTVWSGYRLRHFVTRGRAVYNGRHVRHANTRTLKARRIELDADEEVLLDVDGEQPGRLPATLEIVPRAVAIKVAP